MAWIEENWLRNAYRALKETLDVDGDTKRHMIQFLLDEGFWDLKSWDSAVARFNACLNPNKAEFFKVGEVWALMSRFGRHQLFEAMAADLGYEIRPVPTEARRQVLIERLIDSIERNEREIASARADLQRLADVTQPPRSATALMTGGLGRFSKAAVDAGGETAVQREGCP